MVVISPPKAGRLARQLGDSVLIEAAFGRYISYVHALSRQVSMQPESSRETGSHLAGNDASARFQVGPPRLSGWAGLMPSTGARDQFERHRALV